MISGLLVCGADNDRWGCRCCTSSDRLNANNPNWDVYQVASYRPAHCSPDAVNIDLGNACTSTSSALAQNTLGGLGPQTGAEVIRYPGVGSVSGQSIDLVVSATTSYFSPNAAQYNGCGPGMGFIHVHDGNSVGLEFRFEDSSTGSSVTVPAFQFAFFDLDRANRATWRVERVRVEGYASYKLSTPTQVQFADGQFSGTARGTSGDTPSNGPLQLFASHREKSVGFLFQNVASFRATLTLTNAPGRRSPGSIFRFAGNVRALPPRLLAPTRPPATALTRWSCARGRARCTTGIARSSRPYRPRPRPRHLHCSLLLCRRRRRRKHRRQPLTPLQRATLALSFVLLARLLFAYGQKVAG